MLSLDRRSSFEPEFNRVVITVADMLARHMDDVFAGLIQDAELDRHDPAHKTAEAANRIVVLSRKLADEIRRYQQCDRVRRDEEEHHIPF